MLNSPAAGDCQAKVAEATARPFHVTLYTRLVAGGLATAIRIRLGAGIGSDTSAVTVTEAALPLNTAAVTGGDVGVDGAEGAEGVVAGAPSPPPQAPKAAVTPMQSAAVMHRAINQRIAHSH